MSVIAIAAVDENGGIGYQGHLLAHIPEDMKRFRELTDDCDIFMGGKTWDSLPQKPLPNRKNFVITSRTTQPLEDNAAFISLEESKSYLRVYHKTEKTAARLGHPLNPVWVIGGAFTFAQLLPLCDEIYLTKIYKTYDKVDTYFPLLDSQEWEIGWKSDLREYDGIQYQFINYKRIDN